MAYHSKAVTDPQPSPSPWTVRNLRCLAVNGDNIGRDVTHHTATDVRLDIPVPNRHHRQRSRCRQPEGFVVSARIVAHIIEVTEDEGHGAESS